MIIEGSGPWPLRLQSQMGLNYGVIRPKLNGTGKLKRSRLLHHLHHDLFNYISTMVIGKSFVSSALSTWPYCGHNTICNFFKVFCKHQYNQAKESACRESCYTLIYHIFHVLEELNA
jgi:hypothetical protein